MSKGETTPKKPRSPRTPARTAAATQGKVDALDRRRQAAMTAILAALRAGATRKAAAAAGRVTHEAFYSWLRENRTYEAQQADGSVETIPWKEAIEQAEAQAILFYENTIRRASVEAEIIHHYDARGNLLRTVTKYDWRAAAWWLEHHPQTKEDWRGVQRQEVSGPGGGPIQTESAHVFRPDPRWLAEYVAAVQDLPPEVAREMLPGLPEPKDVTPTEKPPEDEAS